MMAYRHRETAETGFTLIEVVVAMTILGLALGLIFQIFSQGLQTAQRADHVTRAGIVADSVIAGAGSLYEIAPGLYGGSENNTYDWALTIEPLADEGLRAGRQTLYRLDLAIHWREAGRQRTLSVVTVRPGSNR